VRGTGFHAHTKNRQNNSPVHVIPVALHRTRNIKGSGLNMKNMCRPNIQANYIYFTYCYWHMRIYTAWVFISHQNFVAYGKCF
jgi:hypothetical protein